MYDIQWRYKLGRIEDIVAALKLLAGEGSKLLVDGQSPKMILGDFAPRYEVWYTKANAAVSQLIPERSQDFQNAYRLEKRKEVSYDTYTVSDYLTGMIVTSAGKPTFSTTTAFAHMLLRQIGIVQAAGAIAGSVLRDIHTALRGEILDSDVAAARELLRAGQLRPAGVVCGVVLEAHLASVAQRRNTEIKKKNPTIGDYNDALKGANAYDTPTWRMIQRLADIRNLCGHRKEREATKDEVQDLLSGTDKIVREVF